MSKEHWIKNTDLTLIEMPESYTKKKTIKVDRVVMMSNGVLEVTGADKRRTQGTGKERMMSKQSCV